MLYLPADDCRRTGDEERILVLGQGLVSQDALLATRAHLEATARGIGTTLPIA